MKGLLSVSFGTSYEETRAKTIDVVDSLLAESFGDWPFYTAWTSGNIIAKVREERGEMHDTLEEAFARMSADGVDDLLVATMCLMNGHEMRKIRQTAEAWAQDDGARTVRLAFPLMSSEEDRAIIARAVFDEYADVPDDEALVLMGHGSPHGPNEVYSQIQELLRGFGRERVFVATVEGEPTFEDALAAVKESGVSRVHLAPFMIVAGDHATNDLAGEEDDSWKNRFIANGFETTVNLKGLGELTAVQQLVVDHARAACMASVES